MRGTNVLGNDIYLLKLERKLATPHQQVAFDSQIDTNSILKTLRHFIQMCLTKLFLINRTIQNKVDLNKTLSDKDESFFKLTQQN